MMNKLVCFLVLIIAGASCNKKDLTWVAIGDSITYLNDYPQETGNRVNKGYMSAVVEKLPHITYVNQGHNGWTSGGIAENVRALGIPVADVYSVFLGTNDWWAGRPVGLLSDYQNNTGNQTVCGSMRIITEYLRGLNPHARIILITPMQRVDFVYYADMKNNAFGSYRERNGQSLSQFADAIRTIGGAEKFDIIDLYQHPDLSIERLVKFKRVKEVHTGAYVDLPYPDFIDVPFNPETDDYPYPAESADLTYDGLHPSDKGNAIIAEMLIEILEKW